MRSLLRHESRIMFTHSKHTDRSPGENGKHGGSGADDVGGWTSTCMADGVVWPLKGPDLDKSRIDSNLQVELQMRWQRIR